MAVIGIYLLFRCSMLYIERVVAAPLWAVILLELLLPLRCCCSGVCCYYYCMLVSACILLFYSMLGYTVYVVNILIYINIYIIYRGAVMLKNENSIFAAAAPGAAAPASLRSCAALLREVGSASALLAVEDLRGYWLGIMADRRASYRDRLAASRLYADSIGAFAPDVAGAGTSGAVRWLEAEVVGSDGAPAEPGGTVVSGGAGSVEHGGGE